MNKKAIQKNFLPYVLLFLVIISIVYFMEIANQKINELTYNEFISALNSGEVEEITVTPEKAAGVYKLTGTLKEYKENEYYYLRIPLTDESIAKIYAAADEQDFEMITLADPSSSTFVQFLINVLPLCFASVCLKCIIWPLIYN